MAFSWKVTKVVLLHLHSLAILACLARLFYRKRTRRLWWDDFWAFVALISDSTIVVVLGTLKGPGFTSNVLRWVSFITYSSTLWGARLSIAVSIVRLVPLGPGRLVAKGVSAIFALMWSALIIQKLFICKGRSVNLNVAQCLLPKQVAILELCFNITADTWLICSPAYLLWDAKLTNRQQTLIFSVFASNILLTLSSVPHIIFIFKQRTPWVLVSGHIEMATSLMICNLLVLVTWLYSRIYPNEGDEDGSTASSATLTTQMSPRRDAPNYGFEGSVLVLTKMSGSSSPSSFAESSFVGAAFGRNRYRLRSRTFAGWYHTNSGFSETMPSLRPSHSCPALLNLPVQRASPNHIAEKNRGISLGANTVDTGVMAGMPSLVFSTEMEDYISIRGRGHVMRDGRCSRRAGSCRELVIEHRRRIGS